MIDKEKEENELAFIQAVEVGISEGVIGGIFAFIRHNKVDVSSTKKSNVPLKEFASRLLLEYIQPVTGYPYDESFKSSIEDAKAQSMNEFRVLWSAHERDMLRGLCHLVGGETTAQFLEKHKTKTLQIIRDIRY